MQILLVLILSSPKYFSSNITNVSYCIPFRLHILIYADFHTCIMFYRSTQLREKKTSGSDCRPTASMESKGLIVARFPRSCTSHSLSTINLPFNAVPVIIDLIGRNLRQNFCLLLKFIGPRVSTSFNRTVE